MRNHQSATQLLEYIINIIEKWFESEKLDYEETLTVEEIDNSKNLDSDIDV